MKWERAKPKYLAMYGVFNLRNTFAYFMKGEWQGRLTRTEEERGERVVSLLAYLQILVDKSSYTNKGS